MSSAMSTRRHPLPSWTNPNDNNNKRNFCWIPKRSAHFIPHNFTLQLQVNIKESTTTSCINRHCLLQLWWHNWKHTVGSSSVSFAIYRTLYSLAVDSILNTRIWTQVSQQQKKIVWTPHHDILIITIPMREEADTRERNSTAKKTNDRTPTTPFDEWFISVGKITLFSNSTWNTMRPATKCGYSGAEYWEWDAAVALWREMMGQNRTCGSRLQWLQLCCTFLADVPDEQEEDESFMRLLVQGFN